MKSILSFLLLPLTICSGLFAQDVELKPLDQGLSLLSDVKIKKVRLLSETEETLTLEVSYEIGNGKKYLLRGQLLNQRQGPLKEVQSGKSEIANKSGAVDLRFDLQPNLDKTRFTQPYLDTYFVKLIFTENTKNSWGEILGALENDNPLEEALGESFLYRYEKKWRIGGGAGMVITVPITPVGKAVNIAQ